MWLSFLFFHQAEKIQCFFVFCRANLQILLKAIEALQKPHLKDEACRIVGITPSSEPTTVPRTPKKWMAHPRFNHKYGAAVQKPQMMLSVSLFHQTGNPGKTFFGAAQFVFKSRVCVHIVFPENGSHEPRNAIWRTCWVLKDQNIISRVSFTVCSVAFTKPIKMCPYPSYTGLSFKSYWDEPGRTTRISQWQQFAPLAVAFMKMGVILVGLRNL